MTMTRDVRLIDVTLRDAHQCLWATRMTTGMMKSMAPALDDAGFEAIDLVGGAVFDVCVRYLREDPWERMRILSQWITKTPLIIHTRGQSLFTFEFFPDDVVALSAQRFAANGMRYHTPYDALNDIRNLEIPITEAKRHGLTVVPGIVFTESPVHTDEYYVKKTKEVMTHGVDGIFLKDPSGLLRPERARNLVKNMKSVMGDMPLQLHSHCLSGLAPYTALCAVESGVEVVHSATAPLTNGASHPSTQGLVNNLRRMGHNIDINLDKIDEVSEVIKFIAAKENKPLGKIAEYDAFHFHHQVAGGMISNLEYQLSTVGLADRLEDILQEAGNVRADLEGQHLARVGEQHQRGLRSLQVKRGTLSGANCLGPKLPIRLVSSIIKQSEVKPQLERVVHRAVDVLHRTKPLLHTFQQVVEVGIAGIDVALTVFHATA